MIGPAVTALAAAHFSDRAGFDRPIILGAFVLLALVAPLAAAVLGFLGFAVARFRLAQQATQRRDRERLACLEAGELIALGLAGGLSVSAAHRVAIEHSASPAQAALRRLAAEIDQRGILAALSQDRGPSSSVSHALATATAAGSPALPALEARLDEEMHRVFAARQERVRRLPIRLLLPLTLLVLPGFVLMTVGPAVIDSLARLDI